MLSLRRVHPILMILCAVALATGAAASPALAGSFERTGDLNVPRAEPMVVKLANGKVLVAGGATTGNIPTPTAEIYDPATGTFTLTGSMATARRLGAAVLLPSGNVLVVGGTDSGPTAELFNPADGTFRNVSSPMSGWRVWPLATLLDNGKVLVSHGCCGDSNGADLYDPASGATGTFTATTGQPSQSFSNSAGTATKLANGKVLIAGDWAGHPAGHDAQIYDPATDSFSATTGPMVASRQAPIAIRLSSGKVLIAGAEDASSATAETFDPATGLFTATTGNMSAARAEGYIAPLPDGRVLVAGGTDAWAGTPNASADIFDPATGTFTPTASMAVARRQLGVANPPVLSGGRVLFAGGATAPEGAPTLSSPTTISELYIPDPPSNIPDPPSNTFTLSQSRVSSSTLSAVITVKGPGVATQRGSFTRARSAQKLTACTSSRKITKAGGYRLTCELTTAIRSARRRGAVSVSLTTTFKPTGGAARTVKRSVRLAKTR